MSVRQLVQEAYGVFEEDRIVGLDANWLSSQKYDIDAKVDESDLETFQSLDYDHRRLMQQALLTDRFKLAVHLENKERPIYVLILAKNGPKLQESKTYPRGPGTIKGMGGLQRRGDPHLTVEGGTMPYLAKHLSLTLGRTVVDKTGLTGRYDYKLDWTPDMDLAATGPMPGYPQRAAVQAPDPSGPSIFTAIQEQLGLKLESQKGPVEILVVDRVEQPSEN